MVNLFLQTPTPHPLLDAYKAVGYLSHSFLYAINWEVMCVRSVSIDILGNHVHFTKFNTVATIWILKYYTRDH
ncbi:hypothetical protein VAEKB19_2200001 [Vibrio aestuarianus]|nr:hypothetical protein VAEKB19_2200001 [Vibrio aestuarianus]